MKTLLAALLLLCATLIQAQPGALDNTFGTGGKVLQNGSAPNVKVIDIVLQADGKTVVLAQADYNHLSRTVLLRYTTTGVLDATFDGDGIAIIQFGPANYTDVPNAIRLQTDGKILVCGQTVESVSVATVVRYNTNGSPDNSFGTNGILYINDQGINNLRDVVALPSGEIILLTTSSDPFRNLVLIKLASNGTRNASFGTNGVIRITVNSNYEPEYNQLELQPDGKLIVGGTPYRFAGPGDNNLLIVRVNATGTLDNTFGTAGTWAADAGEAEVDNLADIALQTDGKIIATGTGKNFNHLAYTYAVRLTNTGIVDNTFGTGGYQYINPTPTGFASYGQMTLQTDNKAVIAGFAKNAQGNYTVAAARLTTTGVLDNTFDGDGIALLQVNNFNSYGFAPLQQADGKIVLAGLAGNGTLLSASMGRFTTVGQTDGTVAAGSTAIATIGSSADYDLGFNVLLQTDQKIINVRKRRNGFTPDITVTRHLTNGSIDNSFGTAGQSGIDLAGEYSYTASGLLSNGKILVACNLTELVKGAEIGLARFNASGTPDSTFGTNGKFYLNTSGGYAETRLQNAFIQPDGKVVLLVSELISQSNVDTAYLVRLNADGSYDNTLIGSGKLALADTASYDKVLVQADGKILLSFTSKANGYQYSTFLLRYNADGTVDATFNGGNAVQTGTELPFMAVQTDGKIVVGDKNGKLTRLTANGTFDTTFGGSGSVQFGYTFNVLGALKLQPDNKIVLGGNVYDAGYDSLYFQAVRITAAGRMDSTFGSGGIAGVDVVPDNQNNVDDIALQADGKIVMSGYTTYSYTYQSDFAMIRLLGDNISAPVVYTFNGSGSWTAPTNWLNGVVPPATLPAGSSIIIDPPVVGICYLNISQHIAAGASLTVKAGKRFVVIGNLQIQ